MRLPPWRTAGGWCATDGHKTYRDTRTAMRKTAQPSLHAGCPTAGGEPSPGAEDRAFLDPVGFPNTREGERLSVVGQAFVIRREVHAECDLRIPAQPFAPVLQLQRRVTGYATVRLVANPEKSVM